MREIEKLRARFGRSLGLRPFDALLLKEAISSAAYLVRKDMKLARLAGLDQSMGNAELSLLIRCSKVSLGRSKRVASHAEMEILRGEQGGNY